MVFDYFFKMKMTGISILNPLKLAAKILDTSSTNKSNSNFSFDLSCFWGDIARISISFRTEVEPQLAMTFSIHIFPAI